MIDAMTRVLAVIGDPIEHSLSPLMQNWFIRKTGINAVYTAFHVNPKDVKDCVAGMRAMNIAGLNVTAPHKQLVVEHADSVSNEVELLGASNTLVNTDGKISAYVTDPFGFIESLGSEKNRFKNASVVLFGAGGAAMSIVYALSKLKVKKVFITDLYPEKASDLQKMATHDLNMTDVTIIDPANKDKSDIIRDADVLINATAVGMHPLVGKSVIDDFTPIAPKHFIYDLVYNPGVTHFMHNAQKQGASVQNGLEMLIFQGLESFRLFTGEPVQLNEKELSELKSIMNKALGL